MLEIKLMLSQSASKVCQKNCDLNKKIKEQSKMFSTSFPEKSVISRITAKMLIEVEAVRFSAKEPFKFTSGWASPVYIDCRKLISYPRVRHTLMDFAASEITRNIGFESIDSIAGGETAGIPFAAWIADRMMLPLSLIHI